MVPASSIRMPLDWVHLTRIAKTAMASFTIAEGRLPVTMEIW